MFDQGFIYFLCLLLTGGAVVYLLICVDPKTKGPLGVIRAFVLEKIPGAIRRVGTAIFGPRFNLCLDGTCRYIFKTNNPIVMVLYIIIGPGGYLAYLKYGYFDHMPNSYVSSWHLYTSLVWAGFCFYNYYMAVNTDPGVITKENARKYLERYNMFDDVMFTKDNVCPTCNIKKPARSKHSAITNKCISKFDHYCIWIKGDVGEKNYKYFLGFIGGHALLTLYGTWFGLAVLNGLVTKEGLWGAKFRSMETGEIFTAGYFTIFQYLLNRFPIFVFLVILCSVMCLSLTLFFLYHMYLVKLGFTTNEKVKKSCLEDDLDLGIRRRQHALNELGDLSTQVDKEKYIQIKEDIASWKEKLRNLRQLSYSKGFVRNLMDVIKAK